MTNHAEEAKRLLQLTSATTYEATAEKAFAHALLALVEQQRIANIIALFKAGFGEDHQGALEDFAEDEFNTLPGSKAHDILGLEEEA